MRNLTFAAALAGAAGLLVIPTAAEAKSRQHHNRHSSARVVLYPQYGYGNVGYGAYGYQPTYYGGYGYQPGYNGGYGYQPNYGYQPYYGYRTPNRYRSSYYGVSKHQRKHMRKHMRRSSRHH